MYNKCIINLTFFVKSVLELIKITPTSSKKELASKLKLSETRISEIINILKSKNLIERYGANKNGYWIIK